MQKHSSYWQGCKHVTYKLANEAQVQMKKFAFWRHSCVMACFRLCPLTFSFLPCFAIVIKPWIFLTSLYTWATRMEKELTISAKFRTVTYLLLIPSVRVVAFTNDHSHQFSLFDNPIRSCTVSFGVVNWVFAKGADLLSQVLRCILFWWRKYDRKSGKQG